MIFSKIAMHVTLPKHDNKADDNDDPPPPEASMGGVQLNFCFGGGGEGGVQGRPRGLIRPPQFDSGIFG
jgi:hypothetical protein